MKHKEAVLTVLFLMIGGTVLAHHGTNASYDASKEITLTGVVTQFNWHNPHAQLYFDVKEENGNVVSWGAELNSPGVLAREGWTKNEFKAGEIVTITLNPSKAGTPYGNTVRSKPILVDGKERVAGHAGRTTVD
jgi:hypothetical protein